MSVKATVFQRFDGGIAADKKLGIKGSGADVQSFDFRSSPSQLSVLPGPTREDANVVSDLILGEVMATNGIIYALGDAGNVYRRSTAGNWSNIGKLSSSGGGIDYRVDTDAIYLTGSKTVSSISGVVNGTPTVNSDLYASSISTYNNSANVGINVNADQETGSQTTQVLTTFSELSTATRFFQTDIEPVNKVSLFVINKGTGDWTLRLEDGTDAILATATITNANLKNGAWNDFVFSNAPNGQVRLYPAPNARIYHLHVTSTVADGTVSSTSTNDLSTCDLRVYADRMVVTRNGLHPMERFLQYEILGNGNYISAWEPITAPPTNSEWVRAQLTVPMEYECCGLAHTNEFLVAAFEKTSTSTTISPQEGLIIFWDGTSATYNYDVPITEGAPYGLHVYQNVLYYYAGGYLWAMTSPTTQPVAIRRMPGSKTEFSGTNSPIKMYPEGMTTRRGTQLIGWPGLSTDPNVRFGVWSWGAPDKNFAQGLGYNYSISTGSKNYTGSNNLRIGMVKAFDDLLHISWRDDLNGGYGIDKVDNTSVPATTAIYDTLVVDNAYAAKYKGAMFVEVYFAPLPAGATLRLAYQLEQDGNWVTDANTYSSTNYWQGISNYARFDVTADSSGNEIGRFKEIQARVTVTCSGATTAPIIKTIAIAYDDMREQLL